jgi:hypothetical protein
VFRDFLRKNVHELVHGVCPTFFGCVVPLSVQRALVQCVQVSVSELSGKIIEISSVQ